MSKYQSVTQKQAQLLTKLLSYKPEQRSENDIYMIKQCLENVKFLKNYQQTTEYNDMIKYLALEQIKLDQVLFKQGDEGDKFYILLNGQIGLYINIDQQQQNSSESNVVLGQGIREVAKLSAGDAFGELSLLFNEKRTATAVSLEPTDLLVLDKYTFDKYLSNAKNESLDTMVNFFRNMWVLKDLTHKEILKLSTKTTLSKCNSNTIIIRQGEKPKGIFFVHNGIIKIIQTMKFQINENNQIIDDYQDPSVYQIRNNLYRTVDMELEEIGNGRYFADYEIFYDKEVQYSAISITPSEILTISKQDLQSVLPKDIYNQLLKNAYFYPTAEKIKKQFFENLMWKNFKSKVMTHYNHKLINYKRKNDIRVPFLNPIDLKVFQIYDEVKDTQQQQLKQKKIQQQLDEEQEEQQQQQEKLPKLNQQSKKNDSISKKKNQNILILQKQLNQLQIKQQQQNKNKKNNKRTILPIINKQSSVLGVLKQIY